MGSKSIQSEAQFIAAEVGTVMRDRNGDVFVKVRERGAELSGTGGIWGPTWVAYPAEVMNP